MIDGGTEIGDFIISARSSKTKCLPCDGGAYSRTTYAALFAEIGTKYGAGDGSTTFNLPSSAGRTLVAAGTGTVVEGKSKPEGPIDILQGIVSGRDGSEK